MLRPAALTRPAAGAVRRRARGEAGIGIVTVLAISAAVFIAGGMLISNAAHQVDRSIRDRQRSQAAEAAEVGFSAAFARLATDATTGWTLSGTTADTGAAWTAAVAMPPSDPDPTHRLVSASGTSSGEVPFTRSFEQVVARDDRAPVPAGLQAGTALSVGPLVSLVVDGDVAAGGDVTLPTGTRISGALTVSGNVLTGRRSTVGSIRAGGGATVSAAAVVAGNVTATGAIAVGGQITGDALAGDGITLTAPGSVGGRVAPASYLPLAGLDPVPTIAAGFAPTDTRSAASAAVVLTCGDLQGNRRIRVTGGFPTRLGGVCSLSNGSQATVVTDGPFELGAVLSSPGRASLSVVSGGSLTVAAGTQAAPSLTTQLVAPTSVVAFSPGTTGSSLSGSVAGRTVTVDHPLWVHQVAPDAAVDALFASGSVVQVIVTPLSFVEV